MKTRLSIIFAAVAVGLLTVAPSAAAAEDDQYVTVAWEMPSWEVVNNMPVPTWPQTLFAYSEPSSSDDFAEVALPECGYVQIDVYKYTTDYQKKNVIALIAGGVLTAPNQPYPEPLVQAKLVNLGVCESPSPSPTPTPTPTVTPSPTPTPSVSVTPTPTPSASVPPAPELPDTGGSLFMFFAGLAFVAAGSVLYVVFRKPNV